MHKWTQQKGTDHTHKVTVYDDAGAVLDVSAANFEWIAYKLGETTLVVDEDAAAASITDLAVSGTGSEVVEFTFPATLTATLDEGVYQTKCICTVGGIADTILEEQFKIEKFAPS